MNNLMKKYVTLHRLLFAHYTVMIVWWCLYYNNYLSLFAALSAVVLFFHALLLLILLAPRVLGGYKQHTAFGKKKLLIIGLCAGSVISNCLLAAGLISPPHFLLSIAGFTVLLLLSQSCCYCVTSFLYKMLGQHHYIGIIGNSEQSKQMVQHLHRKNRYSYIRYIHDWEPPLSGKGAAASGKLQRSAYSFSDFAKEDGDKELIIATPVAKSVNVKRFISEAEKHCIHVNFIVAKETHISPSYHIKYINGTPVWKLYNEPLRRTINHVSKRIFDLVVSSLVVVLILWWLIPLIGIIIKLESKGPVFFKQLRSGRDNRPFVCLKFRSMCVNADSDCVQACCNDSRITKVGAFLRRSSLDEFPQFLNVLMGHMSIVGPRPHMLRHTEEYSKLVKHYMGRLYLKPGITGWAQVNGYRGETKNLVKMEKRVRYDIDYMEHWSLWFDIKIMFLTVMNILSGDDDNAC